MCSCGHSDFDNSDIRLDNSDTVQVIRRYPSRTIREIVYYKNNSPIANIGFTEKGDTLKFPRLIYVKAIDSLFVFYPVGQFQDAVILFDIDSASIVMGRQPKKTITLNRSTMLKITPEMRSENNKIIGAIKCAKTNSSFIYYPFVTETK